MTRTFVVSKYTNARMQCTEKTPCYCYGKICLVSNTKKCNEGNIFIDGRAICGLMDGWKSNNKPGVLGDLICQALGFRKVDGVRLDGE